jgi:hypothetical protein
MSDQEPGKKSDDKKPDKDLSVPVRKPPPRQADDTDQGMSEKPGGQSKTSKNL